MAINGKDLMASAKAAVVAVVRVLGEFEQNGAAERQLSVEELSCVARDLQNASKVLQELIAALPQGSITFASTAIQAGRIVKDGDYQVNDVAEAALRKMEGRHIIAGWARLVCGKQEGERVAQQIERLHMLCSEVRDRELRPPND